MFRVFRQFYIATVLIGVFSLAACRTASIKVQVISNPQIALSNKVKKVVLVNLVSNNIVSKVGEVLSGEIPGNDSRLSKECINTLDQTMNSYKKFVVNQSQMKVPQKNHNLTLGEPNLSWQMVDSICKAEDAQAVISLEYFNASVVVNVGQVVVNEMNRATLGSIGNLSYGLGSVPVDSRVEAGFRVYDNSTKNILSSQNSIYNNRQNINYLEAAKMILIKNEKLYDISRFAGQSFAGNFFAVRYWAHRNISKYRSFNFKIAYRMAISGQWQAAADMFEQIEKESTSKKPKWRSAYNAALCYEVLGNLPKAIECAQNAYTYCGKNKVLQYIQLLQSRLQRNVMQ